MYKVKLWWSGNGTHSFNSLEEACDFIDRYVCHGIEGSATLYRGEEKICKASTMCRYGTLEFESGLKIETFDFGSEILRKIR